MTDSIKRGEVKVNQAWGSEGGVLPNQEHVDKFFQKPL